MEQRTPEPSPSQSQELPPDVAQLATHHRLGPYFKLFQTDRSSLRNSIILVIVVIAFVTVLMVNDVLSSTGILIDLLVIISCVISLIRAVFGHNQGVYLFENGIIYKKGARYEAVLWQHIQKLRLRKRFLTDPAWFQLSTTDGRKGAFTYLENPEELYAAVERGHQYSQSGPHP